ncbi:MULTISPECIES: chemotaxis protein CheX [unclassified Fusibacter]|uniref:chemotaxis protein CheX n=1 Tax=unclassified Fusibacter TaxID=2624464 RepID=UPI0010108393|nr:MULTISPECIES: chemotaxis protein CheX [unclassified Fusibacter]MCK8059463.1 chemotaxis protein CheX [Fusibacter sp. A2]NPE21073.1 hypothetical protein [Fusibacter sp. A1]RXV62347.1 hypothetical protein DWB64_04505 [Fusibacter sp. A1]
MPVMLRVENYCDASYVAFSSSKRFRSDMQLVKRFNHRPADAQMVKFHELDFSDIDIAGTDQRIDFYHDAHDAILKVEGQNAASGGHDCFSLLTEQASQIIRDEFGCEKFTLGAYKETTELILNQYNVLLITWSDAIRVAILSISEEMAVRIMDRILYEPIPESEKEVLLKASVSELINIVMGQSLKYFNEQNQVKLGTPLLIQAIDGARVISDLPVKQSECGSVSTHIKLIGINY